MGASLFLAALQCGCRVTLSIAALGFEVNVVSSLIQENALRISHHFCFLHYLVHFVQLTGVNNCGRIITAEPLRKVPCPVQLSSSEFVRYIFNNKGQWIRMRFRYHCIMRNVHDACGLHLTWLEGNDFGWLRIALACWQSGEVLSSWIFLPPT